MQASEDHVVSADGNEALPAEAPARLETVIAAQGSGGGISLNDGVSDHPPASVLLKESLELGDDTAEIGRNKQESASEHAAQNGYGLRQVDNKITDLPTGSPIISGKVRDKYIIEGIKFRKSLIPSRYMMFWFGETTELHLPTIPFSGCWSKCSGAKEAKPRFWGNSGEFFSKEEV